MKREDENVKFGAHVAMLRHSAGISQEMLALSCGINRTYMGEIERGEKTPSLLIIAKIARGLNMSKSELMDYE